MRITMSQVKEVVRELMSEVYSEKQRRWACAQAGKSRKNFKGKPSLTKKEADEMCADTKISKKKAQTETRARYGNKSLQEADPKKGTGKKPKGSGRRLYTDEDPSDTVSVKFRTVQDIKDTLSKSSFKSKSHKRQSQIINLIHQRSRAAYQNAKDPKVKARLKKAYDYASERKEASKKKTQQKNK